MQIYHLKSGMALETFGESYQKIEREWNLPLPVVYTTIIEVQ